jgi:hypothetical protein
MSWTAPKTFVANAILTAAELNVHLRDNLAETAPAKATTAGSLFVATGLNSIAQRTVSAARVGTDQATNSTTYTNLTTPGPAVTVTTGAQAFVIVSCRMSVANPSAPGFMAAAVSGATTRAALDAEAFMGMSNTFDPVIHAGSRVTLMTGLTPGANTFTAVYKSGTSGATANFREREIGVLPL